MSILITEPPRSLDDVLADPNQIRARVVMLEDESVHLPVMSGSVQVSVNADVRRTCSLTLLGLPDWTPLDAADVLDPRARREWRVERGVVDDLGVEHWWPQGVFHATAAPVALDSSQGLQLSVEGADRSAWMKRALLRSQLVARKGTRIGDAVAQIVTAAANRAGQSWPVSLSDMTQSIFPADAILGEVGDDPYAAARRVANTIGRDLHVGADGTFKASPLVRTVEADAAFRWVGGIPNTAQIADDAATYPDVHHTYGAIVTAQIDSDDADLVNAVGVKWEQARPDEAPETWQPAGGWQWAEDHTTTYSIEAIGDRPVIYEGDASAISTANQARTVAEAELASRQGLLRQVQVSILADPRLDVPMVGYLVVPELGLDDVVRVIGLTLDLTGAVESVTVGATRIY